MKKLLRSALRLMGYDIRRHTPDANPTFPIFKALAHFHVDVVLDVGANAGQFATQLRSAGYQGDIISFEPLSAEHRQLVAAASGDPKWRVHERGAIGDRDGEIKFNVAGNSVSSSALPMLELHSSIARGSAYVASEMVPIYRLDSVATQYLPPGSCGFLKIDTQGFEWQVLDGAQNIIPHLKGILCEISLVPLYEGQHLWREIIDRLEADGFTLWSLRKGFTDPSTARTLQVDATFFRV